MLKKRSILEHPIKKDDINQYNKIDFKKTNNDKYMLLNLKKTRR